MLERMALNALAYRPFRTFFLSNFMGNSSWFVWSAAFGWYVLGLTNPRPRWASRSSSAACPCCC